MPAFLPPMPLPPRHRHRPPVTRRRPSAPPAAFPPLAALDVKGAERAQEVLASLLAANRQYSAGLARHPAELSSPARRHHLAEHGQKPVAAVIACADSRVAPEIIFGAGLGEVFVVRNAGNVAWGDSVVGSLEFAVTVLAVPLVVVLGHTMCGAVDAAVGAVRKGGVAGQSPLANHVGRIAEVIRPFADMDDAMARAVEENVKNGVTRLLQGDTEVAKYAKNRDIAVVGAVYDITTGQVNIVA